MKSNLKKIRKQKGFSQKLLAEKSDLSIRTIQRIEKGESDPHGDTLRRLTNALEISTNELMEWDLNEDKTFLSVLIISAISFILFPLLGIIIPLLLWITKRDKIKGVDRIGKQIMNFQITWCIVLFIAYILLFLWIFSKGVPIAITEILFVGIGVFLYLYNAVIVTVNVVMVSKSKDSWFYPRLNIIR